MSAPRDDRAVWLYRRVFGFLPVIMAPLGLFVIFVVPYGLDRFPLALQWIMVGLVFASALGLAGLLLWGWTRPIWLELNFYDPTRWYGFILPAGNTLYIAFMATMGFAILSAFLHRRGVAMTSPERALTDPINDTFWYYAWSFLDAIPGLELPRTLGWEQPPFRLADPASRALLLLYKLALVGPVIASVKLIWWGFVGRSPEAKASRKGGQS